MSSRAGWRRIHAGRQTQQSSARPQTPQPRPQAPQAQLLPPLPPPQEEPQQGQDEEGPPPKRHCGDVEPFSEAWVDAMYALDADAKQQDKLEDGTKIYYDAARQCTRLCGPGADYYVILSVGIRNAHVDLHNDPSHPYWHTKDYDDNAQATLLFPLILNIFPLFEEHVEFLQKDPELVIRMAKFLMRVSKKTRTDDLNRIKQHVYDVAEFEDPKLKNKCNRGWNSLECAGELVPLRLRAKYLANPKEFCRTLTSRQANVPKEKRIHIYSKDWFVMMYDMTLREGGLQKPGCLKNKFLVQIGKLLYTSFSSTDVGMERGLRSGKGQPPLAKTYKMKKINFHTILYITILARFAFTAYAQWCDDDGNKWNCDEFALRVLEFSHHNADWVDELEGWWTAQILGTDDDDDDEFADEIAQTSFQLAIANECSGRRQGPPPLPPRDSSEGPGEGEGNAEDML